MKIFAIALFATIAFTGNALAAPEMHNSAVCESSSLSPLGVWDCR
jgi:hypothetical protein